MATDTQIDECISSPPPPSAPSITTAPPKNPASLPNPMVRKSGFERLLDAFLQESSIRWMLVIGAAIISASSLMLVTRQWTTWSVPLKYLTILSYTAATYAVAEYCGRRLRLDATSQVLRSLTLVLIPIGFLSLSWLTMESLSASDSAFSLILLIPATGFMVFAADRIFSHWLHGRQSTFLASYVLLCLAGILPVIETPWLAVLFASGFWFVMTLGVVKVNRHVFWLTEEYRRPRVFGFLPIAMLASLFIVLTVTKTVGALPIHWLGLVTVMMAATVLMTTKTIADVFRTRTGDLVHPLPWSIGAPLLVGLLLTAIGVLLSFHGFHFSGISTRAVVPTTLVAAVLILTLGRDTRHRGFIWAGLILIALAYQSCPNLMGELIQAMKAGAASAIQEKRLPVAFYGLTYAPLLVGFAIASGVLGARDRAEFQLPLKQFVTVVSVFLSVLSLTNLKAACLVGVISSVGFVFNSGVFRDRRFIIAAIGSALVATATVVPFANSMGILNCDVRWSLAAVALFGLIARSWNGWDRGLSSNAFDERSSVAWFQISGESVTFLVSVVWLATQFVNPGGSFIPSLDRVDFVTLGALGVSLSVMTWQSRSYVCGMWMWLIATATAVIGMLSASISGEWMIAGSAVACGVSTLCVFLVMKKLGVAISAHRFVAYGQPGDGSRCPTPLAALLLPLADLTLAIFAVIVAAFYLPALGWATIALDVSVLPPAWTIVAGIIAVAAVLFRSPITLSTASFFAPIVAGVGVGCLLPGWFDFETLPLVYALTSAAVLLTVRHRAASMMSITVAISSVWLAILTTSGLVYLSPMTLLSSAIALATMWIVYNENARELLRYRTSVAILASVQFIVATSLIAGYRGLVFQLPISELFASASVWMLAATVVSLICFEYGSSMLSEPASRRWSLTLRVVALFFFIVCLASDGFVLIERIVIVSSLIITAFHECHVAVRRQVESHVGGVFAIIAMVVAWFHWHHQIPVPHELLRLLTVTAAGVCLMLARRWTNHPRFDILVRGLGVAAIALPPVVTGWSLLDSTHGPVEMLIVFAAAAIWFVHGRMTEQRRYVVGSAVMLNVGLASLFASWSLTDPQMYLIPTGLTVIGLVELLRRDIPQSAHDPLRYLGALTILVSPCFEILGGSWLHLVTLMVLSVLVILVAIGLRLRALIHVGAAFLCVDLVAMVVRSTIDHPGMLWATGLLVGASVIAIAAACEHHRETLLSRIRTLSEELATWH